MWLRGRHVSDTLRVDGGSGVTLHGFSGGGSVALAVTDGGDYFKEKKDAANVVANPASRSWWFYSAARPPIDFHARWSNLGDETRYSRGGLVFIREPARGTTFGLLLPCAPLGAGLAALAVLRVAWYRLFTRRRRRIRAGLCPTCAHEVRGLVERCVNCGTPRARMRIGRVRNADLTRRAA